MTAEEIVEYLERELHETIELWRYCETRGHDDTHHYAVKVYTIESILETIDPPE